MFVFFHPVKFGMAFTLGNLMALGRSVSLLIKIPVYICAPFFNLHVSLLDLGDSKPEFMDGQSIFIELRCSIHMWLCLRLSAAQFWIIRTSSISSAFPPSKYLCRFKLFVVLIFFLEIHIRRLT
jgi:hypothetical protein